MPPSSRLTVYSLPAGVSWSSVHPPLMGCMSGRNTRESGPALRPQNGRARCQEVQWADVGMLHLRSGPANRNKLFGWHCTHTVVAHAPSPPSWAAS